MAKVKIEFPDDVVKKLSKLGTKTDEILEKTLKAGADVVVPDYCESSALLNYLWNGQP